MSVSPARLTAFRVLLRVLQEDSHATELLHSNMTRALTERDQRLATELVFGALRQQLLLDHLLSTHSKTALAKVDPEVLVALRLGAYQVLFLDRVPSSAAINESVELVKAARLRSAAGFANAVLRKLKREETAQRVSAIETDTISGLSLRNSHPQWLVERWDRRFGRKKLLELLRQNNQTPSVCFRSNSPDLSSDQLLRELTRERVWAKSHPLFPEIFEVVDGNLHQTSLFQNHGIAIQDAGSQLIPHLLELEASDVCLDFCAGPGGKTSQLARLKGSSTPVFGMDLHGHRLRVARDLHSGHWKNIYWVVVDGTRPLPFRMRFDKILLDAPCSGTGTLQRHPEIRWRLKRESFSELSSLQRTLMENAVSCLKPGGTLVYSTCSLEEEENETTITSFLAKHPEMRLVLPENAALGPFFDKQKFLHLFPPQHRTDGFFAAVLRKL